MYRIIFLLTCISIFFCVDTTAQEKSLQDSARLYFSKGKITKAIYFGELEMQRVRNLPEKNDTALLYAANDLALFYSNYENYQLAEPLYNEALRVAETVYGKNHYQYASILDNYGKLKKAKGKYAEALSLIREAISITNNKTGKEKEKNLIFCNNLGLVYLDLGDLYAAESQFSYVIDERKKLSLDKGIDYTTVINNLAVVYRNLGNFDAALKFFKQALGLFIKDQGLEHPYTATTINNVGLIEIERANYISADTLLKQSLAIKENIFGKNSDQYALALVSVAKNYRRMEKFVEAEMFLNEALKIREKTLGKTHSNYAITLTERGFLKLSINQDADAEADFKEALAIFKNNFGDQNPDYLNLTANLAAQYFFSHKYDDCILTYQANLVNERNLILKSLDYLSGKELMAYVKSKETYLAIPLTVLCNYYSSQFAKEAYNNKLLFTGIALQNMSDLSNRLSNSSDTALTQLWQSYTSNIILLTKNLSQPVGNRNINCDSLSEFTNQQEKKVLRQSADFRNMKEKFNISYQDVQKNLSKNAVAIEFVKFTYLKRKITDPDTVYYAAMLLRSIDSVPVFIKLCKESELKSALTNFSYKANIPNNTAEQNSKYNNNGLKTNIYNILWQPLQSYLSTIDTIYFAPDGLLHQISFAAISTPNGQLLCDKYNLVQLTSTRQIAFPKTKDAQPAYIALFGGINYNKQIYDSTKALATADPYAYVFQKLRGITTDSFTYLPGTLKEIKAIKKSMDIKHKKVSFYSSVIASEATFRNMGGAISPDLIHFATHGFTLPNPVKQKNTANIFRISDNPLLRCGLVLAGGNRGWKGINNFNEDDGILTALEISSTSMPNTQLVVLSACETGTGEIIGSEGVFGLQRAFKLAGVKYIMASLWQVPDKETTEFMNTFYSNWMQNLSIQDAFNRTQHTMRKKYPPYYWAAFTLIH